MRSGAPHGYTIVEVIIFLAITAFLFATIAATFVGQRGRTQFSTAAREFEAELRDIANDVSTGFYPTSNDFSCDEFGGEPRIRNPDAEQGTNKECVFMGRAVHFNVDGDPNAYAVYTIVGLREASPNIPADEFDEAQPKTDEDYLVEEKQLAAGIEVDEVRRGVDIVQVIAFLSSLGEYDDTAQQVQTGTLGVNTLQLGGAGTIDVPSMVNNIDAIDNSSGPLSHQSGFTMCLNSGSSDQHAVLTVGGGSRRLSTDLVISGGSC